MPVGSLLLYAYLVGAAFSGCAGAFVEARARCAVGLREPFVTPNHIFRSLGFVLIAGPYLLFSELRLARQEGNISAWAAVTGLAFSTGWALASGIILVEFMGWISSLT